MTTYRPGTPDVSYARGAAEALAEVRKLLATWETLRDTDELFTPDVADVILRSAAAELGVEPTPDAGTKLEDITQIVEGGGEGIRTYREVSASPQRPAPEPPLAVPSPTPRRLRACVERWPGAEIDGDYHPHCCRWPKSCSASVYDPEQVTEEDLEPLPGEPERKADQP